MLVVTDGLVYTSEQQFAPLLRHAGELRRQLGLVVRFIAPEQALRLSNRWIAKFDFVGVKYSFRADRAASLFLTQRLRAAMTKTTARLLCFDGDDDLNVLRADLLALADQCIKKHTYRNPVEHSRVRIGKSNLTDYVAREHGRSFVDNEISESSPIDPVLVERITVGWNIGLDDKIAALAARLPSPIPTRREIDVCSRAVTAPESWIYPLRNPVAEVLERMADNFRVLVPRHRVGQDEYYAELQSSTICVSPFGYGEICWRDFEAILCGCLLIKPDMRHVETEPNIFIPNITYVPVRWDYADLPEVCAYYLKNNGERQDIVQRAYDVVINSQSATWFVERFRKVII